LVYLQRNRFKTFYGEEKKESMKIGIDGRLWNVTGLGRYIRNLCINLSEIDHKNEYVLFIKSSDWGSVDNKIKNNKWKIVKVDIKWHSINEQRKFPKIIEKENVDLMHFTYQQSVPVFYKKPFIITIHDLIKHHYITGRSSSNPYWLLGFKMLAYKTLISISSRNAKKIITVSDATRDEIFDHLPVNKRNVEVIYEAVDDIGLPTEKKNDFGDYFLFVGNVYQHKNTDNLIKAFKKISQSKNVKLVFVGKEDYFLKDLKKSVRKFVDSKQIIFMESVTDSEIASLYKNAIALIRPSFMEGFSLPPLEALRCGTLALVSDIPVHREILKNDAIYFNPKDFVDMSEKMHYVLNLDKEKREEMIKNGKKLASRFAWKKTAELTLKIYENSSTIPS